MPKKTKDEDSSSSDSGPDDVNPPPSKKSKSGSSTSKGKSGGSGGSSGGGGDEEYKWLIEKKKFVTVREFRGNVFIDVREYYENDGELKPGKKGISLTPSAWRKLLTLSDDIDEALKKMC